MDYIMCFFYKYGVIAIGLVILIEYACFPISSELVLPFSGVISYVNKININVLIFISVIGGIIGSSICYIVGRVYGEKCLEWLSRKIPKSTKAICKSEKFFCKYGNMAVMIGRVIPLCRTYISFVAGTFKQSYGGFVVYSTIGIFVWNVVLIYMGYILGDRWENVSQWYSKYKVLMLGIVVVVVLCSIIKGIFRKNKIWFYK